MMPTDATEGPDPWMQVPSEVGDALRAGAPRLRRRVIAAIRSEVPAYNHPLRGEFGEVMRSGVEGGMSRFIDMIERHEADALGPTRDLFYDLGRRAFREGRTLDALLRAYRVGSRVALREVVDASRSAGVEPDVVYQLAEAVIAYINELSAASVEGFGAERAAAADIVQAARQELVELLSLQPAPDPRDLKLAAGRARFSLPGRIAALACGVGEPAELAARVGPGAIGGRLGGLTGVLIPDPGGRDHGRLADALRGEDAALGPAVPPQSTPHSWELARRALELMHGGAIDQHGLVEAEEHLATIFLNGDPPVATALIARQLGPLDGHAGLAETLLAWLAHRGRVDRVAQDLHLHPNSVRYRLQKVRRLYGDALDDPDACFELELALRMTGLRVGRPSTGTSRPSRSARD